MTTQTNKRRQELIFTATGEVPTVPSPSTLQWGDAGFAATDIMKGEIAINSADNKVFTRTDAGIVELATIDAVNALIALVADSIPQDTDDIINNSTASGTTLTDAIDILNNTVETLSNLLAHLSLQELTLVDIGGSTTFQFNATPILVFWNGQMLKKKAAVNGYKENSDNWIEITEPIETGDSITAFGYV